MDSKGPGVIGDAGSIGSASGGSDGGSITNALPPQGSLTVMEADEVHGTSGGADGQLSESIPGLGAFYVIKVSLS